MSSRLPRLALSLVAVAAVTAFAHPAMAKPYDADQGWSYVAGSGLGFSGDDDRNADKGWGSRVAVGGRLPGGLRIEATAFGLKGKRDIGSGHDSSIGAGLDVLFPLVSGGSAPYVLAGGGYVKEKVQGVEDGNGYVNIGLGFLLPVTNEIQFRAETRYVETFGGFADISGGDGPLYDLQYSLGIQLELGRPKRPRPVDADHDGVAD